MKEAYIIRKKLECNVMPYILSAKELKRTTEYSLYHSYEYSKEILPLAAGAGLSGPLLDAMSSGKFPTDNPYGIAGAVLFVAFGFFRVRIGKEEVAKRIIGQKKLISQFKGFKKSIDDLSEYDDAKVILEKLIPIQQQITTAVNNAIQENIWPWDGATGQALEKAKGETDELFARYWPNWNTDENEMEETPDQKIN